MYQSNSPASMRRKAWSAVSRSSTAVIAEGIAEAERLSVHPKRGCLTLERRGQEHGGLRRLPFEISLVHVTPLVRQHPGLAPPP